MKTLAREFTLLEVLIATAILAVVMVTVLVSLTSQAKLGNDVTTRASANTEAQRAFNEVRSLLRKSALEDTTSTFCVAATDYCASLSIRPIQDPSFVTVGSDVLLDVANASSTLEVVDAAGTVVATTFDASAGATRGGTLRLRDSTGATREISRNVLRFRVVDQGDYLQVELALKVPLRQVDAAGAEQFVVSVVSGQIPATVYDTATMQ